MAQKKMKKQKEKKTVIKTKKEPKPVAKTTNSVEQKKQEKQPLLLEEKKPKELLPPKKGFSILGIPVYLWALFLILGIAGGVALSVYLNQQTPEPIVIPDNDKPGGPMEIELIYSDECPFCVKHNTIFDTFTFNKIDFKVKEIEATTTEGKNKIAAFQPGILPAAIVPASGLNDFPEIKQAMDQSFKKIAGYYVVPESNLDSSKLYSKMYLETIDETDCNSLDQVIDIILFDDPYNEIMINTQPILNSVLTDFNEYVTTRFEFIPSNVTTLKKDTDQNNARLTAEYLVCSGSQNKFIEGYTRMLSIYCGGKDLALTRENLAVCSLSPHYGTPLTKKEIEAATIEMKGIEPKPFDACLGIAGELNKSSITRALQYGLTRTGTAVVDCKFNVPYQAIDNAICTINPELEPCKNE